MKRKLLSLVLALTMVLGLVPTVAFAEEPVTAVPVSAVTVTDLPAGKDGETMQRAIDNGLLKGNEGKVMPGDPLTRAQMAAIITRAFGATGAGDISKFVDVAGNGLYNELAAAYQMGIIKGNGNRMNPRQNITRQEAFVIIARALQLAPAATMTRSFADAGSVAAWASGEINAMVNAGYVNGDGTNLNINKTISRMQFAIVFDNVLKTYVKTAGEVKSVADGNVMVNVPGVTLKDVTVKGDLIIGDGVGEGDITLDNVKVTGRTVVRGGGVNSILVKGKLGTVIIAKMAGDVRIVTAGGATVQTVYVNDGKDAVILEGSFGTVNAASDTAVTLKNATVKTVNVTGAGAALTVDKSSTVTTLDVADSADGAGLIVEKGAKVTTLNSAADSVTVTGAGTIATMNVTGGKDVTIAKDTVVTKLNNTSSSPVKQGDKVIAGTGTGSKPSTGGSIGGGGGGGGGTVVVNGEFATLEALKTEAAKSATNTTLTVADVNTISGSDSVVITANATDTLTINFKTVTAGDITINATNAGTINLNDTDGAGATFASLTINAPNATVNNNVKVTGALTVQAVSGSTMNQFAAVGAIEMAGAGALELGAAAQTSKPIINVTTTAPVTLKGTKAMGAVTLSAAGANLTVSNTQPIVVNSLGGGANVTANAAGAMTLGGDFATVATAGATASGAITLGFGSTVATVTAGANTGNIFDGDGVIGTVAVAAGKPVALSGSQPIATVTAASGATIGGTAPVQSVKADGALTLKSSNVQQVTMAAGTLTMSDGANLPVLEATGSITVTSVGGGTVDTVDMNVASGTATVTVAGAATVSNVTATVTGTVDTAVAPGATTGTIPPTSAVQTKAAKPDATKIKFVAPTAVGGNGKITTALTGLEYKLSTNSTYTGITAGTAIENLVPGTYYVRVAAAGNVLASEPVKGVITAAVGVTAATITGTALVGNILTAVPNADANGSFVYAWKYGETACGTGKTLVVTDAMVGTAITVTIKNYNGAEGATADSAPTAKVTADMTPLKNAIANAETALVGVAISTPETAAKGVIYVTQELKTEFDGLITNAKNNLPNSLTTARVFEVVNAVNEGIKIFNNAKLVGTQENPKVLSDALTAAITAAGTLKNNVTASTDNGASIAPDAFWALEADITAYAKAITDATAVKTKAEVTPAELSAAIVALNQATAKFNAAKRNGMPIDTTPLQNAIAAANALANSTPVGKAEDISNGVHFVTAKDKSDYTGVITEAAKALTTPATQSLVLKAITDLATATDTFNKAKTKGTKGDLTALISAVEKAEVNFNSVYESADGKNVKSDKPWVIKTDYEKYGVRASAEAEFTSGAIFDAKAAITAGGTQSEVNTALGKLNGATGDFNKAKAYKIAFKATQIALPTGGEKTFVESKDRTETIKLTGTMAFKAVPTGVDFENVFGTIISKDADKYAAINLKGLFATPSTAYTVVQKNAALKVYSKSENGLDHVAGTKIQTYAGIPADDNFYNFLVQKNTPITLEIYLGNCVKVVDGKNILDTTKATPADLLQTIKIDTTDLTVLGSKDKSFTVTFDDGIATNAEQTAITNAEGYVTALPTPAGRYNYAFFGWYTGKNGAGTKFTTGTKVTGATTTVYAHFKSVTTVVQMTEEMYTNAANYDSWAGAPTTVAAFGTLTYPMGRDDVAVIGTANYISGFTGFSTDTKEQAGHYALFQFAVADDVVADKPIVTVTGTQKKEFTSAVLDDNPVHFTMIFRLDGIMATANKTVTITTDWDGDGTAADSHTITLDFSKVTLAEKPAVPATNISIDIQPANASVAAGVTAYLTVAATANPTATLSYQWYSNTTNSATGGTPIDTATEATYAIPTTTAGVTYYYCVVSAPGADPVTTTVATVTAEAPTTVKVANYAELIAALNSNANIISLTQDITLTDTMTINRKVTLDLQGKTLTSVSGKTAIIISVTGDLTLDRYAATEGVITSGTTNTAVKEPLVEVLGKLTMNSGEIRTGINTYYALSVKGKDCVVTLQSSAKVISGWADAQGVAQGVAIVADKMKQYEGYQLRINQGATIEGGAQAIYLPSAGNTTIADCTITGGLAGIEIRAGNLNMSSGTITATAARKMDATTSNDSCGSYTGALVAVKSSYTSADSYVGEINVNVNGGTLANAVGDAICVGNETDLDRERQPVTVGVTGTVTGGINLGVQLAGDSLTVNGEKEAPKITTGTDQATVTAGKLFTEDLNTGKITGFNSTGLPKITATLIKGIRDYKQVRFALIVIKSNGNSGNDGTSIQAITTEANENTYNIVGTVAKRRVDSFELKNGTADIYLVASAAGTYAAELRLVDASKNNALLASTTITLVVTPSHP